MNADNISCHRSEPYRDTSPAEITSPSRTNDGEMRFSGIKLSQLMMQGSSSFKISCRTSGSTDSPLPHTKWSIAEILPESLRIKGLPQRPPWTTFGHMPSCFEPLNQAAWKALSSSWLSAGKTFGSLGGESSRRDIQYLDDLGDSIRRSASGKQETHFPRVCFPHSLPEEIKLVSLIGQGSFGSVFKGRQRNHSQPRLSISSRTTAT